MPARTPDSPRTEMLEAFREYLSREGLKHTRQREQIVELFAGVEGHVSVEELLGLVREHDASIGYATVYRTLKLLVDAGLAALRNFGEGFARYEPRDEQHHDHLICELCGRIEEFHDELIEKRQRVVAQEHGKVLVQHRHELFGVCPDCLAKHGEGVVERLARGERAAPHSVDPHELPAAFKSYLGREGMKNTRQRELIVELFSGVEDHVSVEDLLARVKREDSSIGYATVYRTLKLLVDAGLAACRHFGDGFTRFEPKQDEHHDHLIDRDSGVVQEFHDATIEEQQEKVARKYGFRLTRHRLDLFGQAGKAQARAQKSS